jgi:hypothetical protein
MKLMNSLNSITTLEIIIFIVFTFYLVLNIPTPPILIPFVDSPIGLGMVVILTLYLVLYTTPLLAILSILVAYEFLRRSCAIKTKTGFNFRPRSTEIHLNQPREEPNPYIPSEEQKEVIIKEMNPEIKVTLEEEVIGDMAPVGKNDSSTFTETSYQNLPDRYLNNVERIYY